MTRTRSLGVLVLGALAMVSVLIAYRLGLVYPVEPLGPDRAVPLLIALGLLCVVGLTIRRRRGSAVLAAVVVLIVVTVELAVIGRELRSSLDPGAWRWTGVVIGAAAVLATSAAAVYAADPARRVGSVAIVAGVVGVLAVLGAAAWAFAAPNAATLPGSEGSPLGSTGLVTRTFLVASLVLVGLGLIGETMPAIRRARARVATEPAAASRGARLQHILRALGDEVTPGRSRAHQAAIAERTRMARDLHADVVPSLRHALALAEGGAPPARVAAVLHDILADVESLGMGAHPVHLDVGGLVPALEWLAEQIEARSEVEVTIDVDDGHADASGRPPDAVVAAAFRVAALALDNVVRHAPRAPVAIRVLEAPRCVRLSIVDRGPGIDPGIRSDASVAGRRGLVDMAAEARGCGASLEVASGEDGRGTAVRFAWSAG